MTVSAYRRYFRKEGGGDCCAHRSLSYHIERRLTNLLASETLEDHADGIGVVKRNGKLQIPPLVWSFAFDFAAGESQRLRLSDTPTIPLLTRR